MSKDLTGSARGGAGVVGMGAVVAGAVGTVRAGSIGGVAASAVVGSGLGSGAGSDRGSGSGRAPDRAEVLAMLAALGDRDPAAVGEELGSLELAWLVAETEQRYGAVLDLSEADLDRMATVDGAVAVLREALAGNGAARP